MPKFNGTGPLGSGPGTGWGLGPCGMGFRRGLGRGFGQGIFRGYGYQPRITKKEETEILKEEAEVTEEQLKEIKERLAELKGQK